MMAEVVVGDTAVALVDTLALGHIEVQVSLSGGDLRVRTDGSLPSPSSGVLLFDGGTYTYSRRFALRAKMIAAAAGVPVTVLVEER